MLTLGLLVWILRADKRLWMHKLGWVALVWVSVVGLLGGLTVKLLTPPPVSMTHTCLAQLFFSLTVLMAVFTSKSWQNGPDPVDDHGWPSLRTLAVVTPVLVLAQVALGAGFRHRAMTVMPHIVGAMVVSFVILLTGVFVLNQFPEHRTLKPAAITLLLATFVQVFLGVTAYVLGEQPATPKLPMILITVAHVAIGAITLASSIVLAIQVRRNVRARVVEATAAVTS
jgi:heme A synthase